MIAACCLLRAPVLAAGDSAAGPVDDQVLLLVRQLRSDEQPERVQAQRDLTALGRPAIPGIERAVERAALDQLPYLISALERMFVAGCPPEADEAEEALVRLAESDRSAVSGRATAVLIGHQPLRERRAVAALRELGADVVYDYDAGQQAAGFIPVGPLGAASGIVIPGHELTRISVWLHDDMTGGDEVLRHVTRLEHNWSVRTLGITVFSIAGNGISTEAVQSLAGRLNNANIQERGASLGIKCTPSFGCQIEEAITGGSAAEAGLGRGDEILAIDGKPVHAFSQLVDNLLDYAPGDSATLSVSRFGNAPEDVVVTLGNWHSVVKGEIERCRTSRSSIPEEIPNQFWIPPGVPVR